MDTLSKAIVQKSKLVALTASLTIAAIGATSPAAEAATYNLDFEGSADGSAIRYNDDGTLQTTQWESWKLKNITGINKYKADKGIDNGEAKFNIYNTNVFGGDHKVDRDIDLTTGVFAGKRNTNNKTVKSNNQMLDTGIEKQGGVLIIQEESNNDSFNNGFYTADDEAKGGDILFDFDGIVDFNSFSLLDIDDNGGGIKVEGTRADGSILEIDIDELMSSLHTKNKNTSDTQGTFVTTTDGVKMTQVGKFQGDNSMFRFDIDDAYLTDVRFSFPGSGAISGLEWGTVDAPQEIPEPSAIGGLLMLGFIGKRLKSKRDEAAV